NASLTCTLTAGTMTAPATTSLGPTTNVMVAAAPCATVNAALVTAGSSGLVAVSCLLPARSRLSAGNAAMPVESVGTASPPVSAPVPTSASVTECAATALPNASLTCTWTAGAMPVPATTSEGPTTNASPAAAAGEILNAALVTAGAAPPEAVS